MPEVLFLMEKTKGHEGFDVKRVKLSLPFSQITSCDIVRSFSCIENSVNLSLLLVCTYHHKLQTPVWGIRLLGFRFRFGLGYRVRGRERIQDHSHTHIRVKNMWIFSSLLSSQNRELMELFVFFPRGVWQDHNYHSLKKWQLSYSFSTK